MLSSVQLVRNIYTYTWCVYSVCLLDYNLAQTHAVYGRIFTQQAITVDVLMQQA